MVLETHALEAVRLVVEPMAAAEGLALWGLEMLGEKSRPIIRIYVDDPAKKSKGPTIDQCARLSRHLSVALDVEDVVPGTYTLEVSSPGFERPFFSLEQMHDYVGRDVDLALAQPLPGAEKFAGRKRFKGRLQKVGDNVATVQVDGQDAHIAWELVKKAKLIHYFPQPEKPGGGKQKKKK